MEQRPTLDGLDLIAFNDFSLLSTCRQASGFGVAPISVLAMHEFFDRSEMPEDFRDLFIALWVAMDSEVMEFHGKRAKSEMERSKAKASKARGGRQGMGRPEFSEG